LNRRKRHRQPKALTINDSLGYGSRRSRLALLSMSSTLASTPILDGFLAELALKRDWAATAQN